MSASRVTIKHAGRRTGKTSWLAEQARGRAGEKILFVCFCGRHAKEYEKRYPDLEHVDFVAATPHMFETAAWRSDRHPCGNTESGLYKYPFKHDDVKDYDLVLCDEYVCYPENVFENICAMAKECIAIATSSYSPGFVAAFPGTGEMDIPRPTL